MTKLEQVGGSTRYGITNKYILEPLKIRVQGEEKLAKQRNPKVTNKIIEWEVVSAPKKANRDLLNGNKSKIKTKSDNNGYSQVSFLLDKIPGRYVVLVSMNDKSHSYGCYFTIFTEKVTSRIIIHPTKSTSVEKKMIVIVDALDWLGNSVPKVKLISNITNYKKPTIFNAKEIDKGKYRFIISSKLSGQLLFSFRDITSDFILKEYLEFLPGAPYKLEFHQIPNPREKAPYNQTNVDVDVKDCFGNLIKDIKVKWKISGGKIREIQPKYNASSSVILNFLNNSTATISAKVGQLLIKQKVQCPDIYLRFMDKRGFSYVKEHFRLCVEVFPPSKGKVIDLNIHLKQPESVKFVNIHPTLTNNSISWKQENSILHLGFKKTNVEIPFEDERIVIIEIEYECIGPKSACFNFLPSTISIANSPVQIFALVGMDSCWIQKWWESKTICLHFCLVPLGQTFKKLKKLADKLVDDAQEKFDNNIEICCPNVNFDVCYEELRVGTYSQIISGGVDDSRLETTDDSDGVNLDENRDINRTYSELRELLGRCRRDNCITIYIVPRFTQNDGTTEGLAETFSPNDFPESLNEGDAGPGIVIAQDVKVNHGILAHELGHMLIDLPRHESSGIEHWFDNARDDRDRLMGDDYNRETANKFSEEECRKMWENIDAFSGDCDE